LFAVFCIKDTHVYGVTLYVIRDLLNENIMKNKIVKHFYVQETKKNNKDEAPIYLIITVNGQRSEISTDRRINPDKWDKTAERASGRSESARIIMRTRVSAGRSPVI
jgi:hypothetical protein